MATNETTRSNGRVGGFLNALLAFVALVVILGVGYAAWPKVKAAYYADPAPAPAAPTADTSELDKLKVQLTRMEAQLSAAQAAQRAVVVQSVPQGEAAPAQEPVVNVPPQPAAAPAEGQTVVEQPAPAAAPIVIVSHEGYQQPVITGSGACAVAKGARRCGK